MEKNNAITRKIACFDKSKNLYVVVIVSKFKNVSCFFIFFQYVKSTYNNRQQSKKTYL